MAGLLPQPTQISVENPLSLRAAPMSSYSPLPIGLGPVAAYSRGGGQEYRLAVWLGR